MAASNLNANNPNANIAVVAAALAADPESSALLCALEHAKEGVITEMSKEFDKISKRTDALAVEIGQLNTNIENFKNQVITLGPSIVTRILAQKGPISRPSSSRSKGSTKRKASDPPPPQNVPYIDDLMEHEITGYLRKWTTAVTLISFSSAFPQFNDGLPEALRTELRDVMSVFQGGSGLATLFFSVEAYHEWHRYHSRPGRLWSFVVRRTLSSMMLDFRRSFFDHPSTPVDGRVGRLEPPWILSFGDRDKLPGVVREIVQVLETTEKMARESGDTELIKRRKRMRDGNSDGAPDAFESERFYTTLKLRGIVTRYWFFGRTESRKMLLKEVMFVVEQIRKAYGTNALAKDAGFCVEFHSAEELKIPASPECTIWDIKSTHTGNGTNEQLDALNKALLTELINNFPSLQLTIHFRRTVVNVDPSIDPNSYPTVYDDWKEVYLHNVALSIFAESIRIADTSLVMRESPVALKAVHVLACGLRGFILDSLCRDGTSFAQLSRVESTAMGMMTYKEAGKMDYNTASTIGNSAVANEGNPTTGSMRSIREEMSSISLNEYKEKVRVREEARTTAAATELRSQSGTIMTRNNGVGDLSETFLSF